MKLAIYRDHELSEDGVTEVWAWQCPDADCIEKSISTGYSLYWANALKGAKAHINWHHINSSPKR